MADATEWVVVVPVKELHLAKTRLVDLAHADRADLALAMAGDVIAAARASVAVAGVVVVTNDLRAAALADQLGARVVADATDSGLDAALVDVARAAAALWPRAGIAAVSSDLPCATGPDLTLLLGRAATHPRAVLADRGGDGTTVLVAAPGVPLGPSYGAGSRARHVRSGAEQIDPTGLDGLSLDVDTPKDLADALALGVGERTAAVMLRARTR